MEKKSTFPRRVFLLIFALNVFLTTSVGVAAALWSHQHFYEELISGVRAQSRINLNLIRVALRPPNTAKRDACSEFRSLTDARITLIGMDGRVSCDSNADPAKMDNHLNRPEVIQAIKENGFGESQRFSDTRKEEFLYTALVAPEDGFILRIAVSMSALKQALWEFDRLVFTVIFVVGMVWVFFLVSGIYLQLRPMRELLDKTKSIKLPAVKSTSTKATSDVTGFGEWKDLFSAFDAMQQGVVDAKNELVARDTDQALLFARLSDAVVGYDREGNVAWYNQHFLNMFPDVVKGVDRSASRFFKNQELLDAFSGALKSQVSTSFDISLNKKDGVKVDYSVFVLPLARRTGEAVGVIFLFQEKSDVGDVEKRRLGTIVSISHELKTPLTSIRGFAETLMNRGANLGAEEKGFLEAIVRNVDRMSFAIQSILRASNDPKISSSKSRWVSLEEINATVLENLSTLIVERQAKVSSNFRASWLFVDEQLVEIVLSNLVRNALLHSGLNPVIDICWSSLPGFVELTVTDHGTGVGDTSLKNIFEKFFTVHGGVEMDTEVSGYGLSIVRDLLQRIGGTIRTRNVEGAGFSVVCAFPQDSASLPKA